MSAGSGTMGTGVSWCDTQRIRRALGRTRGVDLNIDTSGSLVQILHHMIYFGSHVGGHGLNLNCRNTPCKYVFPVIYSIFHQTWVDPKKWSENWG